jgi:imidazolonepropionase-like amidohydrolase
MRVLCALVPALIPSCAVDSPRSDTQPDALAITNITVVDVTGAPHQRGMTILVEDGRIQEVGPTADVEVVRGVRVVDGSGKYVIPGLWDAHVHLSYIGPDALPLFVANGITHVRDAGGRLAETKALRDRVAASDLIGPRIEISGANLEGEAWMTLAYQIAPPGDPIWEAGPRLVVSRQNAQAVVDSLVAQGVDFIKARNVWGEDFLALAAATDRAGIPLASHNPNGVNMVEAARAGLDSFEHAETIQGDVDTMAVATRQRMFEQVAGTRALVTPTVVEAMRLILSPDSVILAAIEDTLGLLDRRNRYVPERMRNPVAAVRGAAAQVRRAARRHIRERRARPARDEPCRHADACRH